MTFRWKAVGPVKQYFTVVLFVFQFYPVGNFEIFFPFFGLGTFRSERLMNYSTFSDALRSVQKRPKALFAYGIKTASCSCRQFHCLYCSIDTKSSFCKLNTDSCFFSHLVSLVKGGTVSPNHCVVF